MATTPHTAARGGSSKAGPTRDVNGDSAFEYPLDYSIGYHVRMTYRYFTQDLQNYLATHSIPVGMWYFLRALWQEDGLTQSELCERTGSMAPSAVEQLRNMESRGFIERRRSATDRRKIHVFLAPRARALKPKLLPYAAKVNEAALQGLSDGEIGFLRLVLRRIQDNLALRQVRIVGAAKVEGTGPPARSGRRVRSARRAGRLDSSAGRKK
jgi:DNA-binding MarR family transcriptional regulator